MSIRVLDNGLEAPGGALQYAWFRLASPEGERFRCVALRELSSIPIAAREDYDLLGKQWAAVRGLYNAGVNFLYSAAGIFTPEHIGIIQYYGAAVEDASLQAAAARVQTQIAAVTATLAASYPQSITRPPALHWVEWYVDFIMRRSRNVLALLGHPDPRETRRGLGKEGELPNDTGEDLAAEQNELLFRGLAKLREDFIFQVTAEHLARRRLSEALVKVAQAASNVASRRRGSIGIGFSVGIPILAAISSSHSGGTGRSDSQAQSQAEGASHGWGQSHTDSFSHTDSRSSTVGGSQTHGAAYSHADSQADSTNWGHTGSQGHSTSQAHSQSQSHTESQSVTNSQSVSQGTSTSQGSSSNWSTGQSSNWSSGQSSNWSTGQSANYSESAGQTASQGTTESTGNSVNVGVNAGVNAGANVGIGGISPVTGQISGGVSAGVSAGAGHTWGESSSLGTSQSQSTSAGVGVSASQGGGVSSSAGGGVSSSVGGSTSTSTSSSYGQTSGTAVSQGSANSVGTADTVGSSDSTGTADSVGGAHSKGITDGVTKSFSQSKSWASSVGTADSQGQADGVSENWGQSFSQGNTLGAAVSRSGAQAISGGLSAGLSPGVSINRSWQTEDDVADRVTEVLRQLEGLLNATSAEGGFMTSALLFTASEAGTAAAEALVPQAFHGPNVPTPVLTVRPESQDQSLLREYAWAFLPVRIPDPTDTLFQGLLGEKFSTLQSCPMVSAYTAPALIEEGTAVTVMPPIPMDMGFIPLMPGDVILGHQISPTTRDLTGAAVRLDPGRLMHTMFAGDTGFGKSVAAIRMAYETTLKWKLRTVVLDFGAGWRQLLNAKELEGHVDILQLWPNAARPLRWNPLQIGRNIDPETQWRAFADIFGSIAHLGVRRQKQELLEALRRVYLENGVLIDDPRVQVDNIWGYVADEEEAALIQAEEGKPIGSLSADQRQRLAVYRSGRVGLKHLYADIVKRLRGVPARDSMLAGVLEGILFRLNPLVQGAASEQFAAQENTLAVEDLGKFLNLPDEKERGWGITIIEGGMFLDDFGKAFLLGWIGWHLYTDMVARRVHEVSNDERILQIFFEEANKIFAGAEASGDMDETGGVSASQRFGDMFRDARKYKARLHVITQAPHMIPADIISSCNNLVIAFLKNPKDKDIVLSSLARSEKGFRDEEWRRFVSDIPIGMAIGRFPYTTQRELQRSVLFQPLLLNVREPSDAEIEQKLGRFQL